MMRRQMMPMISLQIINNRSINTYSPPWIFTNIYGKAEILSLTIYGSGRFFRRIFIGCSCVVHRGYLKEFFIPKYTEVEIQTMQETNGTHTANKLLTQHKKDSADTLVLHDTPLFGLIPIAITLLGLAFSVLWITMAKGSKAWYELYESNIAAISKNEKFWEGSQATIKTQHLQTALIKNRGIIVHIFLGIWKIEQNPMRSDRFKIVFC